MIKRNYWLLLIGLTFINVNLTGCAGLNNPGFSLIRPSDEAITAAVNNGLMHNKLTAGTPIQVETHGGVVTLSGYVKTIRQNDIANEIASNSAGVLSVENNLVVKKY